MIYTPRRFYIFMRRTTISHFSFLISHSNVIKGRHAPRATPEPDPLLTSYPAAVPDW